MPTQFWCLTNFSKIFRANDYKLQFGYKKSCEMLKNSVLIYSLLFMREICVFSVFGDTFVSVVNKSIKMEHDSINLVE